MANTDPNHWGQWISARSRAIGFMRREDFARKVGVSRQQITRWIKMERPPETMRSGHDEALARALEADKTTVFWDYYLVDPATTVRIQIPADLPIPHSKTYESEAPLRRMIKLYVDSATGKFLVAIHDFAQATVLRQLSEGKPVHELPPVQKNTPPKKSSP